MDAEQRKAFWDTLISLDGKDIEADRKKLNEKILYPRYLYRYRPANMQSIDALRSNMLFFSTSNYYDDPFDTFINVNLNELDRIYRLLDAGFNDEQLIEVAKAFLGSVMPSTVDDGIVQNMVQALKKSMSNPTFYPSVQNYFRNVRNEIKKDIWSVCFSENGCNEVLWLKYAQQHKGFVLQYDLGNKDLLLCGKQEKCNQCVVNAWGTPIYPIYYSDKRYDGTRYAHFITYCKLLLGNQGLGQEQQSEILNGLITTIGNVNWEKEKITLIKKECHQYDEEWRIILNSPAKAPVMREWIPSAIILGLNMNVSERNLTILAAKEAGIQCIYQSFINDNGELDAMPIEIQ